MTTLTLTLLKLLASIVHAVAPSVGGGSAETLDFTFTTRRSSRQNTQPTGNRYGPLFFIALVVGLLSSLGFVGILMTALMAS